MSEPTPQDRPADQRGPVTGKTDAELQEAARRIVAGQATAEDRELAARAGLV